MNVLILGGTAEASALARALAQCPELPATLSLAGRTRRPQAAALPTRVGGFGGPDGLARYLADAAIGAVVDATHPFAAQMSRHAAEACRARGVPLARLERPPWRPSAADQWVHAGDLNAAAEAVRPLGERILLTVGAQSVHPFEAVPGKRWVVRSIEPPDPPPAFADWTLVQARGPFETADEIALLREHAIEALVTKNSGGGMVEAKLEAARQFALPVVMVERPRLPSVEAAFSEPEGVIEWLRATRPA